MGQGDGVEMDQGVRHWATEQGTGVEVKVPLMHGAHDSIVHSHVTEEVAMKW